MSLIIGRHHCVVLEPGNGWFGSAGEKNTPYIRIPLQITDGPMEGQEVTYQAWITDAALNRTVDNLMEVFEWDGDLVKLAKQVNTGPFVGKPCSIVCEEEEYKGKKRVVIKWLNGPDGAGKMLEIDKAIQLAVELDKRRSRSTEPRERKPVTGYGAARQSAPDPDLDPEPEPEL